DGDAVTVHVSKGSFTLSNPNGGHTGDDFTLVNAGLGQQLQLIDFSDDGGKFAHANLSITATRTSQGGDGLVNVGYLNSLGSDLGSVIIHGDLGRVNAGDTNTSATSPGLASLSVHSLGRLGASTQAAGGGLGSNVQGDLPTLSVATDIAGAQVFVNGKIGSAVVGGSVLGGSFVGSGRVEATGDIAS